MRKLPSATLSLYNLYGGSCPVPTVFLLSPQKGNEIVKYAVDSLVSFAKNDDGRGGHQDFLHDDQSVAIKHTLLMVNASDKSVWQKVAAWLLSLAKRFGNLTVMQLQRASRQLDDVVNGKYDWRISKFMAPHGLSR